MKNLKLLTSAILLVVLMTTAKAGGDDKIGGIRAGFHSSAMYVDGNMQYSHLQGFYVGLNREKRIIPVLNYSLGLEYFQNGFEIDADNKLVLHTVSLPVGLKVKVGPVFVRGGIAPSLIASQKAFVAGTKVDPTDKYKSFDAPVFAGAGFQFFMFTIEARYHWGLIEIDDATKNQYLQLGVGINF